MGNNKKYQRGLSIELLEALQENQELLKIIKQKEHFMGIRNNYFNIYYKGLSIGRFYLTDEEWKVEIAQKYLEPSFKEHKNSTQTLSLSDYLKHYDKGGLHKEVKKYVKNERMCQQRIINNNNANPDSKYYCVDMEYVRQRTSSDEKNDGRFDIIAVAKEPNEQGTYDVLLIELKLGRESMGNTSSQLSKTDKGEYPINLEQYEESLGSGFLGHVANYISYLKDQSKYEKLKEEIVDMIEQLKRLELLDTHYFETLTTQNLSAQPEVIFLTYTGEEEKDQVIKTASKYLFDDVQGRSSHNVQKVIGYDMRKKLLIGEQEYKFKFYFREGNGEETQCILSEKDEDLFV